MHNGYRKEVSIVATKILNIPFIGGDTASFNYDFLTKVAGSVAECPLKIYEGAINTTQLLPPSITLTPTTGTGTLAAGTYYYRVSACDEAGETLPCTELSTTLSATGEITISWNVVVGACAYKIYRGTSSVVEAFITSTTALSYVDTGSITPNGALPTVNTTGIPSPTFMTYNNLVSNGNFVDTTGWIATNVTGFTVTNNEASFNAMAQNGFIGQNINMVANHIIYSRCVIKSSSTAVSFNIAGLGGCYSDGSNSYITKSVRFSWSANTGSWQCSIKDGRASGWDTICVKQIIVVDLTATFGAGNEPTKEWCDKNLSFVASSGMALSPYPFVEITNQAMLDRLKTQNELPITSTNVSGRTAQYNGQTYVPQDSSHPALRADLAGKIAGDIIGNPNIVKHGYVTALITPSSFSTDDESQVNYNAISTLDGTSMVPSTTLVNRITQVLLSFNVIVEYERKFGHIPVDTSGTDAEVLARKITWFKNNVYNIRCNVYTCGLCPTGNKVYLQMYNYGAWQAGTANNSNTSTVPTKLIADSAYSNVFDKTNMIDADGFVHFTVYTDCARTTDSTLIVLTNHGLSANDIVENTTLGLSSAISSVNNNVLILGSTVTGQAGGNSINKYHINTVKTAEVGTTSTNITITNHGLSTGDYITTVKGSYIPHKIIVVDTNNFTVASISGLSSGDVIYLFKYLGTQIAESTVIPSTVYLDYPNIEIQMKASAGYDILVPPNPRRDSVTAPNYDTLLLLQKTYGAITTDYSGKTVGNTATNANCAYDRGSLTHLIIPNSTDYSSSNELSQVHYTSLASVDGSYEVIGTNVNGGYAQTLYALNIIAAIEKIIGTIPIDLTGDTPTDLANKIAWVKTNVNQMTLNWTGCGSGPSGKGAYLTVYTGGMWNTPSVSNAAASPTLIVYPTGTGAQLNGRLQSDGFMYFLAYAEASNGVVSSTISTDCISMLIQFKQPTTAIELLTQNSVDVDVQVTNKAQAYLVEANLTSICNSSYGGSNSALKSALKAFQADIFAMGSGALNNALANKSIYKLWGVSGGTYAYENGNTINTTYSIAEKIRLIDTTENVSQLITSNNKIYLLIYSQYPSDGVIPSSINLDYLNIRVDLSRQPDVVNPISINLPDKWSLLIKGIANAYEGSLYNALEKCFISLYKDSNNYLLLKKNIPSNSMLRLVGMLNGVSNGGLNSAELNWLKYQVTNVLISQHDGKWYLNVLLNNGSILKYNLTSNALTGLCNLYLGQLNDNTIQADAYYESVQLLPDVIFDDTIQDSNGYTQADRVLKGLEEGFENPELCPLFNEKDDGGNNLWAINANAASSADGKTLTLNATGNYDTSSYYIPVLPNNQYTLSFTKTNVMAETVIEEWYNNIIIDTLISLGYNQPDGTYSTNFTTKSHTNRIALRCTNLGTGTFTFSNLSLKRLD